MHSPDPLFLTAEHCRARADLVRQTAARMKIEKVRLNLGRLAEDYEEMAARIEQSAGTSG